MSKKQINKLIQNKQELLKEILGEIEELKQQLQAKRDAQHDFDNDSFINDWIYAV